MFGFLADQLVKLGLNYEFWEWTGEPVTTYWIGECDMGTPRNEDGAVPYSFTLVGTTRGQYSDLQSEADKLLQLFRDGLTAILEDGTGVAVFFNSATMVPTDRDDLKRMEVYLDIREWKVE